MPIETRIGVQSRYDDIRLGIQDTYNKMAFQTVTNDGVDEGNVGLWTDTTVKWTTWLRTTAGVRYDYFAASVGDYQNPVEAVWLTTVPVPIGIPSFLYNPRTLAPYMGPPTWVYTGPWNSGSKSAALGQPQGQRRFWTLGEDRVFLKLWRGLPLDRRARHGHQSQSDGRDRGRQDRLSRQGARRRDRDAHQVHRRARHDAHLLVAEFRLREPVRRRHRHDLVRTAKPPLRHRAHQPLHLLRLGAYRRRPLAQPRPLPRLGRPPERYLRRPDHAERAQLFHLSRQRARQLYPRSAAGGRFDQRRPGKEDGLVRRVRNTSSRAPIP